MLHIKRFDEEKGFGGLYKRELKKPIRKKY